MRKAASYLRRSWAPFKREAGTPGQQRWRRADITEPDRRTRRNGSLGSAAAGGSGSAGSGEAALGGRPSCAWPPGATVLSQSLEPGTKRTPCARRVWQGSRPRSPDRTQKASLHRERTWGNCDRGIRSRCSCSKPRPRRTK